MTFEQICGKSCIECLINDRTNGKRSPVTNEKRSRLNPFSEFFEKNYFECEDNTPYVCVQLYLAC